MEQPNKIHLLNFVNDRPELKSGKVEILAAFIHWMEYTKKVSFATEEDFIKSLKEFKATSI